MCGASLSVLANTLQTLDGHSVLSHVLQRPTHTLTSSGSWIKCIIPLEHDYRLSTEISILSGQSQHTAIKLLHTTETHLTTTKPLYFTQILLKYKVILKVFNHSLLLVGKVKHNITTVMKR